MTPLATTLLTAATSGLLGGLHCVAMCGPLAAVGCTRAADGRVSTGAAVGYLLGRVVSYATVGALLGTVGHHALHILPLHSVQTVAALSVGALAAIRGVMLLWPRATPVVRLGGSGSGATGLVAAAMRLWVSLVPRRGLGLGLVTGVLPCGLLLVGWALAAGTAAALAGALVMAVFAVTTAPGLLLPVIGTRLLQGPLGRLPPFAHGLLWCGLALMVGLRPLWGMAAHAGH